MEMLKGKNFMRSLLSILFLIAGFSLFFSILFAPIAPDKKELAASALEFIKNLLLLIVGFYFGSSQGSSDKSELLKSKAD